MTRIFFCTLMSVLNTILCIAKASEQSATQYAVFITQKEGDTSISQTSTSGIELARYATNSAIRCAMRCQRRQDCKTIDYNLATKLCRLGEANLKVEKGTVTMNTVRSEQM